MTATTDISGDAQTPDFTLSTLDEGTASISLPARAASNSDPIEVIKTEILNRTAKQLDPDLLEGLAMLVKANNMTQDQAIELLQNSKLTEKYLNNAITLAEAKTNIDLQKLPKEQIFALFSHRKNIEQAIQNPKELLDTLQNEKIAKLINQGFGGIYKLMALAGDEKGEKMLQNLQSYMDLYAKNSKMFSIENMSINELKNVLTAENFKEFGKAALNTKLQDYVRLGKLPLSSLAKLVGVEESHIDEVIQYTDQFLTALNNKNGIDLKNMTPKQIAEFFSAENFKIWDKNKSNEENIKAVLDNAQKIGSISLTILEFADGLDGKEDGIVLGQNQSFWKKLFTCSWGQT